MGQYVDTIKLAQNSKYCDYVGLMKDDLSLLEKHKFQEYMKRYVEIHDGELCEPILATYISCQKVMKKSPEKDLIINLADTILSNVVGMEDFIDGVLTLVQHTPPKREKLYPYFAKAFACICCITHKLSSGSDPNEMVKPYLEESEAREKAEEVKNAFFKAMAEIGHPVKEGHGDLKTFLDERRVKVRIDSYVRAEIKRVYNVRDC